MSKYKETIEQWKECPDTRNMAEEAEEMYNKGFCITKNIEAIKKKLEEVLIDKK